LKKRILDLGCGWAKQTDALGVDRVPLETVDLVANLEKFPLPFKDNIFEEIYLNDVIEHIPDTIKLMEELYRIAIPGAKIYIRVINWNSEYNAMDPTHVRLFHENTFNFFGEYKDRLYYSSARFKVESVKKGYSAKSKKLFRNNLKILEFLSYYLNNVLEDLNFTLIVDKPNTLIEKEISDNNLNNKITYETVACPSCIKNKFLSKEDSNSGFFLFKNQWLICKNNCGYQYPIFDEIPFLTQDLGQQFFKVSQSDLPLGTTPNAFKKIKKADL
jgi:SAM-dependent methyltransferase